MRRLVRVAYTTEASYDYNETVLKTLEDAQAASGQITEAATIETVCHPYYSFLLVSSVPQFLESWYAPANDRVMPSKLEGPRKPSLQAASVKPNLNWPRRQRLENTPTQVPFV